MLRHWRNITEVYGRRCVVALNHRREDSEAEIALLREQLAGVGAKLVVARHWAEGGQGAIALAQEVIDLAEAEANDTQPLQFTYDEALPLADKITALATRLYGAERVQFGPKVHKQLAEFEELGYRELPVCIAKTQSSFTDDAARRGAPSGHVLTVREVRLAAGAGFVVAVCGDMLTMPGLPRAPAAEQVGLSDDGTITGLF